MGIQESHMSCVDENRKCSFTEPVPYNTYSDYAKTIPNEDQQKQEKMKQNVCKGYNGIVQQCCNPKSKNANEILMGKKYQLIKPIYDSAGNIVQYQICKCTTDECKKNNCADFKQPTRYEACKARSVDNNNVNHDNPYYDIIMKEHAYPDCFDLCK